MPALKGRVMTYRKPRDVYRGRVYDWERPYLDSASNHRLEFDECEKLIRRVWADYYPGVTPPCVLKIRGYTSRGTDTFIKLAKDGLNEWTVLHELAHALNHRHSRRVLVKRGLPHGPEFIRLLINLVARYTRVPAGPIRRSARVVGLPVAPNSKVPQRSSRSVVKTRSSMV